MPHESSTPEAAHYTQTVRCRICRHERFASILDLGRQYIANAFHPPNDPPALTVPLELIRCRQCSLVQLAHSINRDLMYRTYWYRSGVNNTMRTHLKAMVDRITELVDFRSGDLVIDIGCNDGTTLASFPSCVTRVGVDPSDIEPKSCDVFVNDYFTADNIRLRRLKKARVIMSIAMFYDLDDPKQFARDIRACLADDGLWVLELSYMPTMLSALAYDTVCHEHVTYYRIATFEATIVEAGLEIVDIEFNDMNGGSFRLFVAPKGTRPVSESVREAKERESTGNFDTDAPYLTFTEEVAKTRIDLLRFLNGAKQEKKVVYGYGASTKGQVMLQYCNITPEHMVAIAERNPDKFGLYTPGTNIRICSEEEMRKAKPECLFVFPWYFLPEFLGRERSLLAEGCEFAVPLPKFRIVRDDQPSDLARVPQQKAAPTVTR
jgi:hypothetical protein